MIKSNLTPHVTHNRRSLMIKGNQTPHGTHNQRSLTIKVNQLKPRKCNIDCKDNKHNLSSTIFQRTTTTMHIHWGEGQDSPTTLQVFSIPCITSTTDIYGHVAPLQRMMQFFLASHKLICWHIPKHANGYTKWLLHTTDAHSKLTLFWVPA